MANENCLEGFQCPDCRALEPFDIVTRAIATVHDDGIHETREHEWDMNSPARCRSCNGQWRTVKDFSRTENAE